MFSGGSCRCVTDTSNDHDYWHGTIHPHLLLLSSSSPLLSFCAVDGFALKSTGNSQFSQSDLSSYQIPKACGFNKFAVMSVSKEAVMAMKSYQNQAELLVKDYLLADPFLPYTSVLAGVFACKMMYEFSQLVSSLYFKTYASLTKLQRIEWNNRCISTLHAFFISAMSLYFVFFSEVYSDHQRGLVPFRTSPLSTFTLGVSVGYFLTDLGMIMWLYPSLGGVEYVLHHVLSVTAVAYSMVYGEGQLYTYMVLISETTTPGINLRWYLDTAGLKRSNAYLINGVVIFFAWLVARVLLFGYLFYHVYLHYSQIQQMHKVGFFLVFVVPLVLSIMNLAWFAKIVKGLKKQLAKRQ